MSLSSYDIKKSNDFHIKPYFSGSTTQHKELKPAQSVLWYCGVSELCTIALWLPLGALIFCFITANIFQSDDIHETHCRVYNIVPSISAITGISPQRYLWRICIAFHLGPRVLIGSLYRNYHIERSKLLLDEQFKKYWLRLTGACFWLNIIEVFSLTGVTYISNRENYYVHEKIFIFFMVVSLLHMLCRATLGCAGAAKGVKPERTNTIVWNLFIVAILSTVGIIIFFLKHRLLCHDLAFSWFAFFEYVLACANMAFHGLVIMDMSEYNILVVKHDDAANINKVE